MYCRSVEPFKTEGVSEKWTVVAVPSLEDNYAYLLIDNATRKAAAFDPVEPEKMLAAAEAEGVTVETVLTTHKHWDHAGGNDEIKELVPGIRVIGSAIDDVEGCTEPVNDEDVVEVGGLRLKCLIIPGHTLGSVCYYLEDESAGAVFTGDVLFVAGCGRVNGDAEGGAPAMWEGIAKQLIPLPDQTRVFVGHEYTITNLHFALSVDPENSELKQMMEWSQQQLLKKGPTVPTTMEWEKTANPFVRSTAPVIMAACGCSEPVDVFASIRSMKDGYSPPSL